MRMDLKDLMLKELVFTRKLTIGMGWGQWDNGKGRGDWWRVCGPEKFYVKNPTLIVL